MTKAYNSNLVTCTACGGNPEFDEEGCVYTCFRCCNTGFIDRVSAELEEAEAAAWLRDREAQVAADRKRIGVPDGWSYYWDEYEGEIVLVPPAAARAAIPVNFYDDIPF